MSPGTPRDTMTCDGTIQQTRACELRDLLDRLADKWSLLVVELLDHRTRRFSELRHAIDGISQRMLTLTLRQLERDGLVRRTVYPVVPPRVDYELTPLGVTLLETIQPLVAWARAHRGEIADARTAYDARAQGTPRLSGPPPYAAAPAAPAGRAAPGHGSAPDAVRDRQPAPG